MNKLLILLCLLFFLGNTMLNAQNPFAEMANNPPTYSLVDQDVPTRDQVINDDLIVIGSACVGQDCVNGENFGFDTIRMKENNLRMHFFDTSTTGSFPSNDWRFLFNDSSNGGGNYFALEDATAGRQIFRVEAGAPSNSLRVDAQGDVGIGTASPTLELHITDGDTPAMRLQQDGSAGFGQQIWDVAGNETNFFIRDVTNTGKLPFKIKPGAPDNALFVAANGSIGLGTGNPNSNAKLDLNGTTQGFLMNRMTNMQRSDFGLTLVMGDIGMMVYDTEDATVYSWDGTQWTTAGGGTDNQIVDTFQLNGDDLELSLEDDGGPVNIVDLSGYMDNTDNQDLDLTGNTLSLTGDATTVDLSGYMDNTDIQDLDIAGNILSLTGDATAVDLSGYLDNTDNQNITGSGFSGNILTIGIENGASQNLDLSSLDDSGTDNQQLSLDPNDILILEDGGSVDLSGYLDNTDNQDLDIAGNTLSLTGDATTVDLSGYLDNTDNQDLGLTGNTLSLTGDATTVDLSGYLDNTDSQNITGSGFSGNILTIGIENGASQNIDLSSLDDSGTDNQQLSLDPNDILILEDGGSVDLGPFKLNTDNQILTDFSLNGTVLKLEIEDGNFLEVDIASILAPLEGRVTTLEQQMIDVLERLDIIEECACDGTLGGLPDFGVGVDQPRLFQNIPNPFDNTTSIGYFIPFTYSKANIVVSTTTGKILNNILIAKFGEGSIDVNKANMQAAMYFYTLYVDGKKVDTKRMIVE